MLLKQFNIFLTIFILLGAINCKSKDTQSQNPSVEDKEASDTNSENRSYSDMSSADPDEKSKGPNLKSSISFALAP